MSCRGGVCHVRGGVGCVMEGWGGSCRAGCVTGVGGVCHVGVCHTGLGWVM